MILLCTVLRPIIQLPLVRVCCNSYWQYYIAAHQNQFGRIVRVNVLVGTTHTQVYVYAGGQSIVCPFEGEKTKRKKKTIICQKTRLIPARHSDRLLRITVNVNSVYYYNRYLHYVHRYNNSSCNICILYTVCVLMMADSIV